MDVKQRLLLKSITVAVCTAALIVCFDKLNVSQNKQAELGKWSINKISQGLINGAKSGLRGGIGVGKSLGGAVGVAWAGPISRTGNKSGPIIIAIDGLAFEEVGPEDFELFKGLGREDAGYLGKAFRGADCINRIDAEVKTYEWETTGQRDPSNTWKQTKDLKKNILQAYKVAKNNERPLVIIGHSWGSVLAYLALTILAQEAKKDENKAVEIELFITMGAPLNAQRSLFSPFITEYVALHMGFPGLLPPLKKPNNVKRWVNIWAVGDIFSGEIEAADNNHQINENPEGTIRAIRSQPIETIVRWHGKYYKSDQIAKYICPELAKCSKPNFMSPVDKTLISTALVIDRSGSMRGDKLARAKEATWAYVSAMNPNDLASLSVFSDSADTKVIMARQDALIGRLNSFLSKISATNATNIGAGLDQAYQQMEQIASGPDQKYALLLSDGINNRGQWRPVVDKFVAQRWPIHTVGFGNDADHKTLREIAKLTRGTYRFADISDIVNVYQEISALAQNKSILLSLREALAPRSRLSYEVPVSRGTQALNVYTSWQGSRLGAMLTSPSGVNIDPVNLNRTRGRYAEGQLFQMLEINKPEPGKWVLNIGWTVPPPVTEQVNISVSEKSDIFASSLGFRSQYASLEPVLINIQAAEVVGERRRIPLQDASVTLQIQKPGKALTRMIQTGSIDWTMLLKMLRGNCRGLTLYDDGLHDEYHPGDGIFGNTFTETDENGPYLVTASIVGCKQNGETIEKKLQGSFQVGPIEENKITLSQMLAFIDQASRQIPPVIKDPEKTFDNLLDKGKKRFDRFKRNPSRESERFLKDFLGQ